ncbi:thioredoxin family protein [Thiothrix nivea]|uniref:Alkyl hydroperoxide reductase/ Thiol specific antioxidant/ Mal allergen n=1 Tax=Thiothrix nivea (strain ATCC 35100 / DSM 5205 / JP2) TaxID=870187 RepID=A0A656HGL4_THINJ|nr:thioredoxin family protein [Thiothrix nivea]EIJ35352.1 alkyl hydroperoxide reductase/ Thiol specific antioxidant/ Mal allergen [Thiothrix nivea DSM 5205]
MARTPSTMPKLSTTAPDFALPEPITGHVITRKDFMGKPLLVAFLCNHCPYVIHIRDAFASLAKEYQQRGVAVVAINANDAASYPDDSPEKMAEAVQAHGYTFPYLYDESQAVAKAYQAACTPDLFLFDEQHTLFYRGQFDDARPGNAAPVTGNDLRHALDRLLDNMAPPDGQKASLGCNIKWKTGNEPDYYGS